MQTRVRQASQANEHDQHGTNSHSTPNLTFLGFSANDEATGGALLNRKDPRNAAGEVVPILDRNGEAREGVHNYWTNQGKDFTSLDDRSRFKRRIPATSVVNKIGDIGLFGVRLTAAQWLWWTNLVALLAHTSMFFITLWIAYWRKDISALYGEDDPYEIRIFRLSAAWSNSTREGYIMTVVDNNMPINIAYLVMAFFLISAVFHLFAVIAGAFECFFFIYWRQIDDAFCWWRWLEYSGSASVMLLLIATSMGIREQYTLACLFMLCWCTMVCGWLCELYSRPQIRKDTTSYGNPVGRLGFINKPDYTNNSNALHLISQDQWEGDRPIRDADGNFITPTDGTKDYRWAQRMSNYTRRMLPHVFGIFPFMTCVVIVVHHLEYSKWELSQNGSGAQIPAWINAALYGTLLLFSSFVFPQIIFQWLPPGFYWGTELTYVILSLTAKVYLGSLFILNVFMQEGRASDLLGSSGLEMAR